MNVQPNDEQAIIARVEKLERDTTRLKRIGAAVLLVGSVVVLMGQAKLPVPKQADDANTMAMPEQITNLRPIDDGAGLTPEKCFQSYVQGCYEKIVATIPTTKAKVEYLVSVADDSQTQVIALKLQGAGVGTYQIAATRFDSGVGGEGISFAQVFRVDTRTGYVCQVLGPEFRNAEAMGTSIPECTH